MFWKAILLLVLGAPCLVAADPAAREKELVYLRCLMPEVLLPYAHVEVPAVENISIEGEGGDSHLALRVFPGQKKLNRGIRAEVSVDYPHQAGETVRYAWKLMLPPGFKSDSPQNRWWIIGQWHDQPDTTRGESWEDFPSKSPPVLIGLGELNGKPGIGLNYGLDQSQKRGPFFLELGKWHQFAVVIHWSQKADGKASFFLDDMTTPIAVMEGPNRLNDFQHFLKLGMYRHPEIATDNWIHLDDLEITPVREQK